MNATNQGSDGPAAARSVSAVMERVGRAQRFFELLSVQFTECSSSYSKPTDGRKEQAHIGVAEQVVHRTDDRLSVSFVFEFIAPSPFAEEQEKEVDVRARMLVDYEHVSDRGSIDDADANAFGRVNGIYNAWPFLREFLSSSLVRLSLPPFPLPLLRPEMAAQLAGMVDPPTDERRATEGSSDEGR